MSRLANWRRAPGEPDCARRWLFCLRDRESTPEKRRQLSIEVGARGIVLVVFLILSRWHGLPPYGGPIAVTAGPILSAILGTRRKEKPQELALEPPGPGEAFRVGITIRDAHGLKTGSDQGWLIFSEGWILFEGDRTEFAVTRGESYRRHREVAHGLKLEDGRTVVLRAMGESPTPRQLDRAFTAWEIAPIPDGEALLPPREFHPTVWVERHSLWMYGTVASAAIVVFGVALGSWPTSALGIVALAGCLSQAARCARGLRTALPGALVESDTPLLTKEERLTGSLDNRVSVKP